MKLPWSKPQSKQVRGSVIRSSRVSPADAKLLRELGVSNRKMVRMFEAAISNNLNADFPITISSGNAEIFTSVLGTRARARTLERDNPYGWAMVQSMMANVGGHEPFRLEMKVGKRTPDGEFIEETDTNRMIEEWWEEAGYPENCTVRRDTSRLEMDLQAIAAMVRDGGIIWRHRRAFPKNPYRYAVQPLEIDRLDHYYNGKNPRTGNDIIMSKEVDEFGGVVSYWLLQRHPGDIFFQSNAIEPKYREEVPAEDIIALFDLRTRAEQQVGITRFASVIQHLHRIGQFDTAHVTAAIWSACKPLFLLRKFPTANEVIPDFMRRALEQEAESLENEEDGYKEDAANPGETTELPYGVEPWQADPKFPIESAPQFKKDNIRAACAGSGTTYHMIANDLEGVNFSSGRLGENQFHDTCKILQRHFVLNARRPHFNVALEYAILSGELKLPYARLKEFQRAARFYGRRWPYVNPLQDVNADVIAIQNGLTSRDRVIQESDRGGDVEEVNAEIAAGRKSDERHKLDFGAAPKAGAPGKEPANNGDDDEDAPPSDNGKARRNGHAMRF